MNKAFLSSPKNPNVNKPVQNFSLQLAQESSNSSKPKPEDDSDDDVQLIKVERVRPPTASESHLRLPPAIAKAFFRSGTEEPSKDPLEVKSSFPCATCKRVFSNGQHLVKHMGTHVRKPSAKRRKGSKEFYTCAHCDMSFEKQVSLAAHMNVHRDQVQRKPVKCKECSLEFSSNGVLWIHRQKVHNHVLQKCPICCKTFATVKAFEEHKKRHEADSNMCEICGKNFTMQNTLKIHMRLHTGEKPFLCSDCGKSFITNVRLQEHIRRHKNLRRFECGVCGKKFYEKNELRKHSYVHREKEKYPHICDICGKGFVFLASLRQHRRIHTGERPYKCNFEESCQRFFSNLSQMKRHVRGAHLNLRPFKCQTCARTFLDKQNLEGHMKRMLHFDGRENGFECPTSDCGSEFKSLTELNEHQEVHKKPAS